MEPRIEEQPWVTFCMTTYKRPEFLRNQLLSLLNQTFGNFQIVISDNDIEASGQKIVDEINDPRIHYDCNKANFGMVKSFNRSLHKATTEYVVMITDDDPVYPEMLETLYSLSREYPGFGIYYGGCDIKCMNPEVARSSRLKVGTNSCLANLPIGTVRTFDGKDFPLTYFSGEIGGHILWSTGIVEREIALEIGGMPDFGAPYNTDFGYIVLSGSRKGALLLNTSLGCQVVHGQNYGFTEADFEKFYITPEAFYNSIMNKLPADFDTESLKQPLQTFIARWVVEYAVSIKKFLHDKKISDKNFNVYANKIFKISYLKKWKYKYLLAINFPNIFEFLIEIKKKLF
ncbi:MAG TPA: glycosyltransferase family A protein [Chitinophagaceae bacterium]|nr:glycosyltransferase family A protein [Chitinophagaceae bacterium]